MIYDTFAVVSADPMKAMLAACELRRMNIAADYFSGSLRKQWQKAKEFEFVVLLDEARLKDMFDKVEVPYSPSAAFKLLHGI
jgi:hypothetical protein